MKIGKGGGSLKPPPLRRLRRLARGGPSGSLEMANLMRVGMQQVDGRYSRHAAKLENPSQRPAYCRLWTGLFCPQYVGKASSPPLRKTPSPEADVITDDNERLRS